MSERPAIVLLHGFTNSGDSWASVVSGLGERYRAIAPDIRGHASAGDREPVTLPAVLADIGELDAPRFTLIGYSQGGRIALHAALAMPQRIARLILIGASPGLADTEERRIRRAADDALADQLERMTIEEFAERWAQTPVLAGVAPDVAAAAHRDRLRSTPAGLARALRGLGTGAIPSVWDRLGDLEMPVTLVTGERDRKFTETAREMSGRIAQATLVVVPGAGHAVHLERPDAIVALL